MKELSPIVLMISFAHICFLCAFLDGARAQEGPAADSLRRGLTWQHNGQVFSILSRGSQYRPSARRQSGSPSQGNPVVVLSSANDTARGSPRVPAASSSAQLRAMTHQRRQRPDSGVVGREDVMVGDDPYNPYKPSNYDPYYNYYNSYYRPRPRVQPRPGYGTSYHQNGKKTSLLIH